MTGGHWQKKWKPFIYKRTEKKRGRKRRLTRLMELSSAVCFEKKPSSHWCHLTRTCTCVCGCVSDLSVNLLTLLFILPPSSCYTLNLEPSLHMKQRREIKISLCFWPSWPAGLISNQEVEQRSEPKGCS